MRRPTPAATRQAARLTHSVATFVAALDTQERREVTKELTRFVSILCTYLGSAFNTLLTEEERTELQPCDVWQQIYTGMSMFSSTML